MFKTVDNVFTYEEVKKFIFAFLTSNGIEYDSYEKEYTSSPAYGIEIPHKYCRVSNLPAPFDIGNLEIHIYDDRFGIKYVTYYKRYFDPSDELGYKLYGPEVDMMQDFWYMLIPELDSDDIHWDYKYGGLIGWQINSYTMKYVLSFLDKLFVKRDFKCSERFKNEANKYISQFDDYSKNYSPSAYSDFIRTVGSLWYVDKFLWDTIPFICHRWDAIEKIDIEKAIGVR